MGELARAGAALVVPPGSAEGLAEALGSVLAGRWRPDPARVEELAGRFDLASAASAALATLREIRQ